jgi:uncharacterized protein YfdQ (DUF2303 family)
VTTGNYTDSGAIRRALYSMWDGQFYPPLTRATSTDVHPREYPPLPPREDDPPMDEGTAVIVRDLATENAGGTELDPGTIYAWINRDGKVQLVDLQDDKYLKLPKRKKGVVTVDDVESFGLYYAKHHVNGQSEIWAQPRSRRVVAVLDAHTAENAYWQEHQLVLALRLTPEWLAWTGKNNAMLPQLDFAEFLDEHIADVGPADGDTHAATAAELQQLASDFSVHRSATFGTKTNLRNGAVSVTYVETIEATGAGTSGEIDIPPRFYLRIRPFPDSDPVRMPVKLRYRTTGKALTMGYIMENPEGIITAAMNEVAEKIADLTGAEVMTGTPS